jgi:hypothetical protein
MNYIEYRTLQSRGPVNPEPDRPLPRPILVGTEVVAEFEANHSHYGEDRVEVLPAWTAGDRAWLMRYCWLAADGYCASGTREEVVSFEEGVKILIEHGIFRFQTPPTAQHQIARDGPTIAEIAAWEDDE